METKINQEDAPGAIDRPANTYTGARKSRRSFSPADRGGTILFIDDEEIITEIAKEIIEALGYSVMTANSGPEGIDLYSQEKDHIDLVILDMMMPEMDGLAVFHSLKRIDPNVKTLLASGYSLDERTIALLREGCSGFIQKPFTMNDLSTKLSAVLREAVG